ncbi:MAG TPA: hypothetical protein VJQ43_02035 [Thermoplasmata archaeon]|nr:hypothetical protein [Thermoplasmata archaeon]
MPIFRRSHYLTEAPPEGPVLAAATYLPLPSGWSNGRTFARYNREVERQLAASPGALAYSLQRTVFGRRFWTLSLWTDPESMHRFVRTEIHATAARWLRGARVPGAKFASWTPEPPRLDWSAAFEHLGMPAPVGRVIAPPTPPPPGWRDGSTANRA